MQWAQMFFQDWAGIIRSLVVGVLAGLYPASRASSLDPVVALRAE